MALKIIKAGMDSRQVVARFEAERQALALMNHPAIAQVYDAGETPRGLPYTLGEDHPETLTTKNNIGFLYLRESKYDAAEKLLSDVLTVSRRVSGEDNPTSFPTMTNLALAYARQGRHEEYEKLFRATLEQERRLVGEKTRLQS